MRISRDPRHISIRDRPAPFWALGIFLVAGGAAAVALPLGLAANAEELEPWERFISVGIGLGAAAGGLWWLWRSPRTDVRIDMERRRLTIIRTGLSRRRLRHVGFDEVVALEIARDADSEGSSVWRPALRLRTGEVVALSELWSHDRSGMEKEAAVMAEALRIAPPVAPP